jgi:hypothetical protein
MLLRIDAAIDEHKIMRRTVHAPRNPGPLRLRCGPMPYPRTFSAGDAALADACPPVHLGGIPHA